jgi:8-oxo-dGTP diphosphatase
MGLDYALLSPVKPTASHPDAIPMGWKRFAELARQVSLPVYALGGMGAKDVRRAICCGGQGIAAMRGLWPG